MIAIDYFRSKEFDIPADYRYYKHLKGKTKYKVKSLIAQANTDL